MNQLKDFDLNHHAYYLVGDTLVNQSVIDRLGKEFKIKQQGNPDFFNRSYETFAIDDARELKTLHETRPVDSSGKKIFILTMNGITTEAQNALLKLFEEPSDYAHFFLIIPSAHLLLPTVKSRMSLLDSGERGIRTGEDLKSAATSFLKLSQAKRLEEIKKLVDDISKEKKTKQDAISFLYAVEEVIYRDKGVKGAREALVTIETVRNYMTDRAPSLKMLLEYMALLV